ncbi:MAG: hypothetical protein Kow00129_10260 [Thermoleophilia bacterium]
MGVAGREASVEFTVTGGEPARWMRRRDGTLSVRLVVDLLAFLPEDSPPRPAAYRQAFRAGFLHLLGRMLESPTPDHPHPIDRILEDPRPGLLPRGAREALARPLGRRIARGIWEYLEGHRTDGLTRQRFPHAEEYFALRDRAVLRRTASSDRLEALLASCGAHLRGAHVHGAQRHAPPGGPHQGRAHRGGTEPGPQKAPRASLPDGIKAALDQVHGLPGTAGSYRLAEVVLHDILPHLLAPGGPVDTGELSFTALPEEPEARERVRSLADREEFDLSGEYQPIGGQVVYLPHVDGGETPLRVAVADAHDLEPTELTERVLERLELRYGPEAHVVFAEEAAALRRALRINWDRRYRGRYRSGKRIGIPNLRRYVALEDPRVFQKLEVPESLSYYFHLLVDASYSMFHHENGAKAIAGASAFAEALTQVQVPVDVTLYSSAVTVLFDHQRHSYEPYFGGDFSFLISGTMEMEAIGWAKTRADLVEADQKLIVVLTDGTPVGSSLPYVGAPSLEAYYRDTLLPWLKRAGIDLLGLGLGIRPAYHPFAVSVGEGWDALPVFLNLLEALVKESRVRTQELWR